MQRQWIVLAALVLIGGHLGSSQSSKNEFLKLEATIPMPEVRGRIDHLALDLRGMRLFVAALENNTVETFDLNRATRVQTLNGLAEPQGIAYVPSAHRLFVANRKDGSVRSFDTDSWKHLQTIQFGEDADNLRIDPVNGHVWVGYGSGALAEFDLDGSKAGEIKLDAHPESFQLERNGPRAFVNLPKSRKIAVLDRRDRKTLSSWNTNGALSNYPMALDEQNHRLFVVTRSPARLLVLDTQDGRQIASHPAIGDCDDVFYDQKRRRIYAIGGEGGISIFAQSDPDRYTELGRVATSSGTRTGYFSSDTDRLYLAVRAAGTTQKAEIRVYIPVN